MVRLSLVVPWQAKGELLSDLETKSKSGNLLLFAKLSPLSQARRNTLGICPNQVLQRSSMHILNSMYRFVENNLPKRPVHVGHIGIFCSLTNCPPSSRPDGTHLGFVSTNFCRKVAYLNTYRFVENNSPKRPVHVFIK